MLSVKGLVEPGTIESLSNSTCASKFDRFYLVSIGNEFVKLNEIRLPVLDNFNEK